MRYSAAGLERLDAVRPLRVQSLSSSQEGIGIDGIKTQLWTSYNPDGCRYWLDYEAFWGFGMFGSYMQSANINLYDKKTLIGTAAYETDIVDPIHFGAADDKLRLLTKGLFAMK